MAKNMKHKIILEDDDMNKELVDNLFGLFIREKENMGKASDTIISYKSAYTKFSKHFEDKAEYNGDIYGSMFTEWAGAMKRDGLAVPTINSYLGGMRTFMYWCMDNSRKYIKDKFTISLMKGQEEPPKDYTIDEVKALLEKPKGKKFTEWRSWAVACFVIGTGARTGTMINIQMQDINLKEGRVHYRHTKNKKVQNANMSPQLVKSLSDYISKCRKDSAEDDYLFPTIGNTQLSRNSIKYAYGLYAKSRGVNKTNLHGLRHTFAREWYLNGGDVVQLSKVLGHSTIKMSEKYMNIYADMARDRFMQVNPLEHIMSKGNARKKVTVED
jgi:integrase/recombinase XerD